MFAEYQMPLLRTSPIVTCFAYVLCLDSLLSYISISALKTSLPVWCLISHLASVNLPVTISSPLSDINVSRPQHRMNPVAKWGSPAASDIWLGTVWSFCESDGKLAPGVCPINWTEHWAKLSKNTEPSWTRLQEIAQRNK